MFVDFLLSKPIDPMNHDAVAALVERISALINDKNISSSITPNVEEWGKTRYPKIFLFGGIEKEWTLFVPGSYSGKDDGVWRLFSDKAGTDRLQEIVAKL